MKPDENQSRQHEESKQRRNERESAKETQRPEPHKVGVLSVVDAVRDVKFPKTFDDLKNEAGDRKVRTSEDKEFPLSKVLDRVNEQVNENDPVQEGGKIPSLQDFQTVVQRHWGAIEWAETNPSERPEHGGFQPQQKEHSRTGQ